MATDPVRRMARVALRTERDSNSIMRILLANLDKQMRLLSRKDRLDKAAARSLDRVLKLQGQAWSDLAQVLSDERLNAWKAANTAASDAEKHLLDLLPVDRERRRLIEAGPDPSRSSQSAVAQRVSASARYARKLLARNLNKQETGRELSRTVQRQISPRTKGGISYVAQRLVRTEIAGAFHEAQIVRASMTPWVTGMSWHISSGHQGPDICDIYNNEVFAISRVPPLPHPNCACTLRPVLMSKGEFLSALNSGLFNEIIGRQPDIAGNWNEIE